MNSPTPAVSPEKIHVGRSAVITAAQLKADPDQPRKDFNAEAQDELAASIKVHGLINPIVVRPNGTGYIVVDGERRFRACVLAGIKDFPVYVRDDLKDTQPLDAQLVANLQREGLSLSEQCESVARLVKECGAAETAKRLGKSAAWVSKRAGSAEWPAELKTLVAKGDVVDIEIASGLAQLHKVGHKRTVTKVMERITDPKGWQGPLTRDELADEVETAKDAIKRKQEADAAAEKAKKTGKPVDPHAESRRKETELYKTRGEKWKLILPSLEVVQKQASKAIGAEISGPRFNEHYPDAPPASVDTAKFTVRVAGSAKAIKEVVSKTGLTFKLECWDRPSYTIDQALKIEAIIGKPLRWGDSGEASGKQLMALAAKCGSPIKLPEPAGTKKPEAKPAATTKKKAKR